MTKANMTLIKKIFWTKCVGSDTYKELEKSLNKKVSYNISQQIIDYSKQTIAIKASAIYDKDGNVLNSYTYRDFELKWNAIFPESRAEYMSELISKPSVLRKLYKLQQVVNQEK